MEYIFMLYATPDGKAIHRVDEFIDSATTKAPWSQLQDAIVAHAEALDDTCEA
jgi:TorA maturation chaperone TorD